MRKEIRTLSADGKNVQVTFADERWYIIDGKEYPSVTWIAEHYPKGVEFYRWLANMGWDESRALMEAAGDKGHKVHQGITELLLGNKITIDSKLRNSQTGEPEEISLEEYEGLMSFAAWHAETKPTTLVNEHLVINEKLGYAGTADYVCEIDGVRWLVDFKTSKNVYPSHEIQLSAYAEALPPELKPDKLAILQVGYGRNRKGFKWNEIDPQLDLFMAAKRIWEKECGNQSPKKKDYPVSLSLS